MMNEHLTSHHVRLYRLQQGILLFAMLLPRAITDSKVYRFDTKVDIVLPTKHSCTNPVISVFSSSHQHRLSSFVSALCSTVYFWVSDGITPYICLVLNYSFFKSVTKKDERKFLKIQRDNAKVI